MLFIIYMQNIISSFYRSRTRTACFFTYRVFIKCCVFRKTTIFKTLGPSLTFCGISLASVCTQDRHSANWFLAEHTIFIEHPSPIEFKKKNVFFLPGDAGRSWSLLGPTSDIEFINAAAIQTYPPSHWQKTWRWQSPLSNLIIWSVFNTQIFIIIPSSSNCHVWWLFLTDIFCQVLQELWTLCVPFFSLKSFRDEKSKFNGWIFTIRGHSLNFRISKFFVSCYNSSRIWADLGNKQQTITCFISFIYVHHQRTTLSY